MAKRKGSEIKPLDESEYTSFEVNEFSDGLTEEIISLSDGALPDGSTPIKMFSFNDGENNSCLRKEPLISFNDPQKTGESLDITGSKSMNPSTPTKVGGLTPAVDGESFSIKRCYQFRSSTLKKLNQLKGESDNFNIYLNEIIDQAICYYHNYVFNKK